VASFRTSATGLFLRLEVKGLKNGYRTVLSKATVLLVSKEACSEGCEQSTRQLPNAMAEAMRWEEQVAKSFFLPEGTCRMQKKMQT